MKIRMSFINVVIAPYKGELEMWYQSNCSFLLDLQLIFMTAWVILVPTSKLYEKWFKDLPKRSFKKNTNYAIRSKFSKESRKKI